MWKISRRAVFSPGLLASPLSAFPRFMILQTPSTGGSFTWDLVLSKGSYHYVICVTLIFNVERPDEHVILRPVSMHRVMFNCTSKFRINGFMRKKSVVMENSFCFNPKIWDMSLCYNKICCLHFNPSTADWIAGTKLWISPAGNTEEQPTGILSGMRGCLTLNG